MTLKTLEDWIQEIDFAIDRVKTRGGKIYYAINAEMTNELADKVEIHYVKLDYEAEFKKCYQCKNTFDIIISWE